MQSQFEDRVKHDRREFLRAPVPDPEPFTGPVYDVQLDGRALRARERAETRMEAPQGPLDLTATQQLGERRNHYEVCPFDPETGEVLPCYPVDLLILDAMLPHKLRWQARAASDDLTVSQRRYAAQRARSCGTAPSVRAAECGLGGVWNIKCGCRRSSVGSRCNVRHACEDCATRVRSGYATKIEGGLRRELNWLQKKCTERGYRRSANIRMVTLTARHSGDLVADRARINKAFDNWKRWLREEIGYAPAYAGTWEVTAGNDGLGHPHLHVCFVTTDFSYKRAREAWQRCIGDSDAQWDVKSSKNPERACRYVAKYVCKLSEELPDEMVAAWLGGTYGKRTVTASRGMLRRLPCPCCSQYWSLDPSAAAEWLARGTDLEAADKRRREELEVPWEQAQLRMPN